MPEPYWPKRKGAFTLSDADRNDMLIRVRCPYDKRERWFLPAELRQVYGDIEVDDLVFPLKCTRCGSLSEVKGEVPPAAERQKITLRRLVEVRYVRRAKWRDEPSK